MRKVNLILVSVLVFAAVLAASCSKESTTPVTPVTPPIITASQLLGQWNFQSFVLNGTTITGKSGVANDPTTAGKSSILVSMDFTSSSALTWEDAGGSNFTNIAWSLDATTNTLTVGEVTFSIQSYNGSTLVAQETSGGWNTAVYTWVKG